MNNSVSPQVNDATQEEKGASMPLGRQRQLPSPKKQFGSPNIATAIFTPEGGFHAHQRSF